MSDGEALASPERGGGSAEPEGFNIGEVARSPKGLSILNNRIFSGNHIKNLIPGPKPNSFSVSRFICSSLSSKTKPHCGLSF